MTVSRDQKCETNQNAEQLQDSPLPRPKRRKNRAKADRGLPPEDKLPNELSRLATEYLRRQRRLWPELTQAGLLPEVDDEVIADMVADFKNRHRGARVELPFVQACLNICKKLGGNYNRYSCDNSNPKSICDQLCSALDKARHEGRFVPWCYVFCDYSITGRDRSRQGYSSYKKVLLHPDQHVETTYIDDFTRASRNELEWWRLAAESRRMKKRLIGASDGFDLSHPNSDLMIWVFNLISHFFIKGTREKVMRRMHGAARRRGCLGRLSLGHTRVVRRDEYGNIVRDKDGVPEHVVCIDPATRQYREDVFKLFVERNWSRCKIARHFCAKAIEGSEAWTQSSVRKLLWSATAIGVFIWNKTRREYDPETNEWVTIKNPRKDWDVYYDPKLAIVPLDIWKAARKKLAAQSWKNSKTGRKLSWNEASASTLFSGTLRCAYCGQDHGGQELKLVRSDGKYKSLCCIYGTTRTYGCQLTSSKSTKIIENCLLGYIQNQILTEESVESLVTKANAYLKEEAARPRTDTASLKAGIRDKEAAIKKLFGRMEKSKDDALTQAFEKRIAEIHKEVNKLKLELREADRKNEPPPEPLDLQAVRVLLAEGLRDMLHQEIPATAHKQCWRSACSRPRRNCRLWSALGCRPSRTTSRSEAGCWHRRSNHRGGRFGLSSRSFARWSRTRRSNCD